MGRRRRKEDSQSTMLFLAFVLMFCASATLASNVPPAPRVDYDGWRVLEVVLEEEEGDITDTLSKLRAMEEPGYLDILRTLRDKGVAEVAVSPQAVEDLRQKQQDNQIVFSTIIQDLGKKLNADLPSLRASPLNRGVATYERYMKIDEITAHLEALPHQYADKVKLEKVGESIEKRPIYLVTVTSNTKRKADKPIIFIDGGIHAREWISPSAALNIIGRLLESPSLTRNIEWRIIPMLNPDGYAYSWTGDRLWRKNRASVTRFCTGTDLNRNFGHHWGEAGASDNPCSGIYRGSEPFSEPESKALRDAMVPVKDRIQAYITIHSYGQYILYPWGYTTKKDRYNDGQLFSVGDGMAKAIKKNDGTVFSVGTAAKLLYPAAGASDDWAAGELKIPLVYTLELRDEGAGGFVLPEHLILPAINDAWISVKYLAKQMVRKEGLKLEMDTAELPAEPRTPNPPLKASVSAFEERTAQAPVPREPESSPVHVPIFTQPVPWRRPSRRQRFDSSEEDSSSEESSEEDSDEDRK